MNEPKQYSPEYLANKKLDERVRQAQRVRVWTAVYAAVIGDANVTHQDDLGAADMEAEKRARTAVEMFDKVWPS